MQDRLYRNSTLDKCIVTIHIKAKLFNVSQLCTHTPTEEKDEVTKDVFCKRLLHSYEHSLCHDVKILLGGCNVRIGKEAIFGKTVEKFHLLDEISPNGLCLIDFAGYWLGSISWSTQPPLLCWIECPLTNRRKAQTDSQMVSNSICKGS